MTERKDGTRRIYGVEPKAIADLRAYFDSFWEQALAGFKAAGREREERHDAGADQRVAVRKSLVVKCDRRAGVRGLHAADRDAGGRCTRTRSAATRSPRWSVEEQVGGRIYERHSDGGEGEWGTRARVGAADAVRDELVPGHDDVAGDAARGAVRGRRRRHARRPRAHAAGRSWPTRARRPAKNYDDGWDTVLGYYTRLLRLMGYSIVNVEEIEGAGPGGAVRFVRRELGCEAFGINWFELPSGRRGSRARRDRHGPGGSQRRRSPAPASGGSKARRCRCAPAPSSASTRRRPAARSRGRTG